MKLSTICCLLSFWFCLLVVVALGSSANPSGLLVLIFASCSCVSGCLGLLGVLRHKKILDIRHKKDGKSQENLYPSNVEN